MGNDVVSYFLYFILVRVNVIHCREGTVFLATNMSLAVITEPTEDVILCIPKTLNTFIIWLEVFQDHHAPSGNLLY